MMFSKRLLYEFFVKYAPVLILFLASVGIYYFENPEQPEAYKSIFHCMWWSVCTLTTVGYGDITPQTVPGQILSSFLMIMGYGIIAIPTGIVTAELTSVTRGGPVTTRTCPSCMAEGHHGDAAFCFACGDTLAPNDV